MQLRYGLLAILAFGGLSATAIAADTSALLYRIPPEGAARRPIWDDGHFGPIAAFQTALRARLAAAGVTAPDLPGVDGKYGPGTHAGIRRLLGLAEFADLAPAPGQNVGMTTALWQRLLPGT